MGALADAVTEARALLAGDCWTTAELVAVVRDLCDAADECAVIDEPAGWDGIEACYVCGKPHDPTTCGWCDRCGDYHPAELDCAP